MQEIVQSDFLSKVLDMQVESSTSMADAGGMSGELWRVVVSKDGVNKTVVLKGAKT